MSLKNYLAKTISFVLITLSLYQTLLSINAILFIYPYLKVETPRASVSVQTGLIEKALILYATMATNGVYGISLLLKPLREVKIFHLLIGFLIAIVSVVFVTKTPFTTDPIVNFVLSLTR